MPHVEIICFPGRSKQQKALCARKIANEVSETLNFFLTSASVAIREVEQADWKKTVLDTWIAPDMEPCTKKPEYSCD